MLWLILGISVLLAGLGSNCSWELIFLKPECEVCVSGLVYVAFFFFFSSLFAWEGRNATSRGWSVVMFSA